jgi:hypothetical protein
LSKITVRIKQQNYFLNMISCKSIELKIVYTRVLLTIHDGAYKYEFILKQLLWLKTYNFDTNVSYIRGTKFTILVYNMLCV